MPIEFNCPHCLKGYRVADSNVGKRVKCKTCGNTMTVPDLSGLTFADDTREIKRPTKRASSTKILPADRPARKQQVHSETVKLRDRPAPRSPQKAAEPADAAPKSKLPGAKLPSNLKKPPALPAGAKAPGGTRAMPEAPKKRSLNFVLLLGVTAMITGFFLPWFTPDLPDFSEGVAGFMLPLKCRAIVSALFGADLYVELPLVSTLQTTADSSLSLFALYLMPVLLLYAAIDELRCAGKGKSHWWVRILAMLSPVVVLGVLYVIFRESLQNMNTDQLGPIDSSATLAAVGPGAWTLLGGWLLTSLSVVLAPKVKKPKLPEVPADKGAPASSPPGKPKLPTPRKPE